MQPYVVHATFQRHHTPGKRARLREHGLWKADPPAYFTADRLLAYTSGAGRYVAALDAAAARPLPLLLQHLHAMAYQLAELRDAFAMARTLNRTLVGSPPPLMNEARLDMSPGFVGAAWRHLELVRSRPSSADVHM